MDFAVLLWTMLMGNEVFESEIAVEEGAHVYAHSRKDGLDGKAYLVINNSKENETEVTLPKEADLYLLTADFIRCETMKLNGRDLVLGENDELPDLSPVKVEGKVILPPATIAFIVL